MILVKPDRVGSGTGGRVDGWVLGNEEGQGAWFPRSCFTYPGEYLPFQIGLFRCAQQAAKPNAVKLENDI